ncbi:MAG: hypothetical protein KDD36_00315 [Flavobacteriales bacterium]|nr:hypothetical protein [Flavobacteriales bacterium]
MRYLVTLLLILPLLQGCKPDPILLQGYKGEVTAVKNGRPWRALIRAVPSEPYGYGFDINVDVYNEYQFLRESLFIFRIPYKNQWNIIDTIDAHTDSVITGAFYATVQEDGDVIDNIYHVFNAVDFDNYITVTHYNEHTGEVSGEFQLTTIIDLSRPQHYPNAVDTIRFEHGKFTTVIRK